MDRVSHSIERTFVDYIKSINPCYMCENSRDNESRFCLKCCYHYSSNFKPKLKETCFIGTTSWTEKELGRKGSSVHCNSCNFSEFFDSEEKAMDFVRKTEYCPVCGRVNQSMKGGNT